MPLKILKAILQDEGVALAKSGKCTVYYVLRTLYSKCSSFAVEMMPASC